MRCSWILLAVALLLPAVTAIAGDAEDEMLAIGDPFVDFELPAHDGSTVRSADLAGRPFLLFFYPKANTPG
jgi:cytochrome oxidase Cu insertion factor (SCO1/SenC/PrrC family)